MIALEVSAFSAIYLRERGVKMFDFVYNKNKKLQGFPMSKLITNKILSIR